MINEDENKSVNELEVSDNNLTETLKSLIFGVGGLIVVLSIAVLLPMFLTYLSEGDTRAPSEIHPTDSVRNNSHNNYAK